MDMILDFLFPTDYKIVDIIFFIAYFLVVGMVIFNIGATLTLRYFERKKLKRESKSKGE